MWSLHIFSGFVCLWLIVGGLPETHSNQDQVDTSHRRVKRFVDHHQPDLWPKATIPYVVDAEVAYKAYEYKRTMTFVEDQSCIRYVPWKNGSLESELGHNSYLNFLKAKGCWATTPSVNARNLTGGVPLSCCGGVTCLHELGHALGFHHEQKNPKNIGWVSTNWKNIWPKDRQQFKVLKWSRYQANYPFDITSPMIYLPWAFSTGEHSMVSKFEELPFRNDGFFYFFMEVGDTYQCHERYACADNTLTCVNDGYRTVVSGKCRCKCPTGLDPDTGCATILKKAPTVSWPKGAYSMLKPDTGCPGESFEEGNITIDGIESNHKNIHLFKSFCSKPTTNDNIGTEEEKKFNWPLGSYCVLQHGGECPEGFSDGDLFFGPTTTSEYSGVLPDGNFDNNVSLHFCCQYKGYYGVPTLFPADKPFILYKNGYSCQQVVGMHVRDNQVLYAGNDNPIVAEVGLTKVLETRRKGMQMFECHYRPTDMNCGDVIILNNVNSTVTIEGNATGHSDLECTWLIKGNDSDGTMVIETEYFNLPKGKRGKCVDNVEIRHARIGQHGLKYCGTRRPHSIRSIYSSIMVRFNTFSSTSTSSFKLNIKWIPNSDLCYDVKDNGRSYDGKVNHTRIFEPCINWVRATNCPHHPYNNIDKRQGLTHNYCRNPDNSIRPWCYIDADSCLRNFCDVCGLESPSDVSDDCDVLIKRGINAREYNYKLTHCAKTFYRELFPNPVKPPKYTEIKCKPPVGPDDGKLIGDLKTIYRLGEVAEYQCVRGPYKVSITCMTSGQWSPATSACVDCDPENTLLYDNACYRQQTEQGVKVVYAKAVEICKQQGGHLPFPKTRQEENVIKTAAIPGKNVWLGITDRDIEDNWVYDDGRNQSLVWSKWIPGEPNNNGIEDCAIMKSNRKWIDVPCDVSYGTVVCVIPRIEIACRDYIGDRCRTYYSENPSMCTDYPDFANNFCKKTCGLCKEDVPFNDHCTLPAVPDKAISLSNKTSIAIGEWVRYECTEGNQVLGGQAVRVCLPAGSLTGKPLQCGVKTSQCKAPSQTDDATPFFGWYPKDAYKTGHEIEFHCRNNSCVFKSTCSLLGQWSSVDHLCKGCKVEFRLLEKISHTYYRARSKCRSAGGTLAAPRNQQEMSDLKKSGFKKYAWIGINDIAKEGKWVYEINEFKPTYTKWYRGEPNNFRNIEDCAITDRRGGWRDVPCWYRYGKAVCSFQLETTTGKPCKDTMSTQCTQLLTLLPNMCQTYPEFSNSHCPFTCGKCPGQTNKCSIPSSDRNVQSLSTKTSLNIGEFVESACSATTARVGGYRTRACLPNGKLTGEPLVCEDLTCGPPTIPNGKRLVDELKQSYLVGEEVKFQCVQGNGTVTSVCLTNGNWYTPLLTCSSCRDEDTMYKGICYRKLSSPMTFIHAVTKCRTYGGRLAGGNNEEEHKLLSKMVGGRFYWLGINDMEVEGTWIFDNGTDITWQRWAPSEPNNFRDEDCASAKTKWLDVNCIYKRWGVCAIPVENCEDSLVHQCQDLLQEWPMLCQIVPEFTMLYCRKTCGVCTTPGTSSSCVVPENKDPTVYNVLPYKPNILVGEYLEQGCISNTHKVSGDNKRDCLPDGHLTGQPLKCQANCLPGHQSFGSSCYSLIEVVKAVTNDEAEQLCKAINKMLAAPKSEEEAKFMSEMAGGKDVLIGIKYLEDQQKWVNQDGTDLVWSNLDKTKQPGKSCAVLTKALTFKPINCDARHKNAICTASSATDMTGSVCEDSLGNELCSDLLTSQPTLCRDQPKFVEDKCRKSCGVCNANPKVCQIGLINPNVIASKTSPTVAIGETIRYSCANYTYRHAGDTNRICRLDGQLGGTPLVCAECPPGYFKFYGSCQGVMERLTFDGARLECSKLGGDMVIPRSPAEAFLFGSLAMEQDIWINSKFAKIWTGISSKKCYIVNKLSGIDTKRCTLLRRTICTISKTDPYVCYDPRDRGFSYNGKMDVSVSNKKCLSWAETASCADSPFKPGIDINRLEKNYCRNPDDSIQPWCYVDGCTRQFCDVCLQESPKDTVSFCWRQRDNAVCKQNVTKATEECESTCSDLIPDRGPGTYTQIECPSPIPPADGDFVGPSKPKYRLGDVVTFKCKTSVYHVNSTCMTDGTWTETKVACSECPYGSILENGLCYIYKPLVLNYYDAQKECAKDGARLPQPTSKAENDFIFNLGNKKSVWLNAENPGDGRVFLWADGTKVTWTRWDKGNPAGSNCVFIADNKKWQTMDCTFPAPNLVLICVTPRRTDFTCEDLNSQCSEFLKENPTMCRDKKQLVSICPKSCGQCQ